MALLGRSMQQGYRCYQVMKGGICMKNLFASIGVTIVMVSLIVGCGQSAPKPTYQKMTIPEALKKIAFKVLQPTSFPFEVTDTAAEIGTLNTGSGRQTELLLIYQNKKEQKLLVEAVTNAHVTVNSNGTEKNLKLSNGEDAIYQDDSILGILYWWTNNESYTLQDKLGFPTSNNTKPFLTPEQLVKIADSVK